MDQLPLIACTLDAGDIESRRQLWKDLVASAYAPPRRTATSIEIEFPPSLATEVAEACRLEKICCSFFEFSLKEGTDRFGLSISTVPGAVDALDGIMEMFDRGPHKRAERAAATIPRP